MIRRATVITDCSCGNAAMRQAMAWSNFAGTDQPTITSISGDVDGSGMLVDALVESRGEKWVILCQRAPRDKESEVKRNGSPFGYFWYKNTLVMASLDGYMLSLAKRLGFITNEIRQMDISRVLEYRVEYSQLSKEEAKAIERSQFRSLKFAPRAAGWIFTKDFMPTSFYPPSKIPNFGTRVWWVDNFGNCKTSLRMSDVGYAEGKILRTNIGDFPCIYDLRAVPEGQQAAVVGSSGLEGDEFIELVVQGVGSGSAARHFGLSVGSEFEVLDCK